MRLAYETCEVHFGRTHIRGDGCLPKTIQPTNKGAITGLVASGIYNIKHMDETGDWRLASNVSFSILFRYIDNIVNDGYFFFCLISAGHIK